MEHCVYMRSGEYLLTVRTLSERGAVIDNCARGQTRGPWGAVLNCPVTHVIRDAAPAAAPPAPFSLFTTQLHEREHGFSLLPWKWERCEDFFFLRLLTNS